jgi:hypothetical protein
MVRVRAQQRVYYAGKEYAPGDVLDVTDRHALQLGAIRKVVRVETPPPSLDVPPKGRHKRRDMKAED